MKSALHLVLLLSSSFLQAQDVLHTEEDSVQVATVKKYHLYISPVLNVNQFVETGASFVGIQLGIDYKNKFDFSIYYSRIIDIYKKQIIFPGNHQYDQDNFGFSAQYSFFEKRIRPHFGIGSQYAVASWEPVNDSNETFVDHIIMFNAYIGANWRIGKFFTLQVNGGYNVAQMVELVGLETGDFNGFKVDILVKFKMLSL